MLRKCYCSLLVSIVVFACKQQQQTPAAADIEALKLKRGRIISCGADQQFGRVGLEMSCDKKSLADFQLGLALLHSFEYDEAEKAFSNVIEQAPDCAMAYWGVAMSNFHALWAPPSVTELQKGYKAVQIAHHISNKTKKETGYINAASAFFSDWENVSHKDRCIRYRNAMKEFHQQYPDDKELAALYALSLVAAADPADKTYASQLEAGKILNALYPDEPEHPGIVHYIIHAYDYPGIAQNALTAARKYAGIAPSSAHALHMPSHIFTRLGLWDECIAANTRSVSSAQCYAEESKIGKHWDEELHGLDYLVYAYLQKGDNHSADSLLRYLYTITEVKPTNFKVAYSFAAIPARILLENKNWKGAANLQNNQAHVSWKEYPWQESITHFARLIGASNTNAAAAAQKELRTLEILRDTLLRQKDSYKAQQVDVQILTGEAWIAFHAGRRDSALTKMNRAAELEEKTEKHPVTPGEILPARELLGDMFMKMDRYKDALEAYQHTLRRNPGRWNSLYGAAAAANKLGNASVAEGFFRKLIEQGKHSERIERSEAQHYLDSLKGM